jgi:hypothetical protein
VLDPNDDTSPFLWLKDQITVAPDQVSRRRGVWFGDAPEYFFRRVHRNTGSALMRVSGGYAFSMAVASTSAEAPNSIVVHAKLKWSTDFDGTNTMPGSELGRYQPTRCWLRDVWTALQWPQKCQMDAMRIWVVSLGLAACSASPSGQVPQASVGGLPSVEPKSSINEEMTMPARKRPEDWSLSADPWRLALEQGSSVIVASVASSRWTPLEGTPGEYEAGDVSLVVVAVVRGETLRPGMQIEVRARRGLTDEIRRDQGSANHWNDLRLQVEDLLLVVCEPVATAPGYKAHAAELVKSISDEKVEVSRWLIRLASLSQGERRRELESALLGHRRLYQFHALRSIHYHKALEREAAVEVLAAAVSTFAPTGDSRLSAALADLFDAGRGSDAVNVRVLNALERGILAAPPLARSAWVDHVNGALHQPFSTDPVVDRHVRVSLIRAAGVSAATILPVIEGVVEEMVGQPRYPATRERYASVLEAYRAAAR